MVDYIYVMLSMPFRNKFLNSSTFSSCLIAHALFRIQDKVLTEKSKNTKTKLKIILQIRCL